jgi:hypothetical protein
MLAVTRRLVAAGAVLTAMPAAAQVTRPVLEGQRVVRSIDSLWTGAVARQTRSVTGAPGPRYWSQRASYTLRARLDPVARRVSADGELRFHNRSPDTLTRLALNLGQNLFQAGAPHDEPVPVTGGMSFSSVCVLPRAVSVTATIGTPVTDRCRTSDARHRETRITHTVMWVQLPTPLLPGDSVDLYAAWTFALAEDAPRTGTDGSAYLLSYWYPQFAVYDDVVGWSVDPYLGTGEFYADAADYDVQLSVPTGYLVGGTGVLRNSDAVLTPEVRDRLQRAGRSFGVVPVVSDSLRKAGAATARAPQLTWHFMATQMRDAAFFVSRDVVWDAMAALVPRNGGGSDTVMIHALYRPRKRSWRRAADYGRQSIEHFSRTLWRYPWPQMTLVEGVVDGGMEYPMLTAVSVEGDARELFAIIAHEVGHMWAPMQVSSDERRFAWMDEGIASWLERSALRAVTGHDDDQDGLPEWYRMVSGMRSEESMLTHADHYGSSLGYTAASYDKLVVVFRAFAAEYGDSALVQGLRAYGAAWTGRHPYPPDFTAQVFAAAGAEREAFVREWVRGTGHFDARITDVSRHSDTLTVTISSAGGAHLSVPVTIARVDGPDERIVIPAAAFRSSTVQTLQIARARTVSSVVLDPERRTPDLNPGNQRWAP